MNEETLKRIESWVAAATERLPPTTIPSLVLPADAEVKSLESLMGRPARMRQTFRTERIADFIQYVKAEHQDGETAVFVEPNGGGALAVIDFGTHEQPLWGSHKAKLDLNHTPAFKALKEMCAAPRSACRQRSLTDWLEDWSNIITPMRDGQVLSVAQAVAAIRRVDLKKIGEASFEEGDFSSKRSAMESVEAESGAGKLPGSFEVECRVYEGTETRQIPVRLSLITSGEEPAFSLRIQGEEAIMENVAEEVELAIATKLSQARVYVGSV